MKHFVSIIGILLVLLWFSPGSAQAQSLNEGARLVDAKLDFKGHEVKGHYVVINYEIPYSGMVEIHLYNEAGEKIWQNQYPHPFGENRIILKADKFNPGEKYAYILNYKKDQVRESIIIPPTTFGE